ncbi:host nuclease inhibitor protein [Komagataeibacter sp. FNDCF1]|uniref:host nuclease inhibitor protein n=1 Tax=Komagataeibacter sp. FNDCF1 TaxID=2878681 RepID=UPI001E53C54F|nr:host nuclease inhibitor protein [Komagataeibacter sp. FNDCF1]MCE2566192.1 host nuclease inhibitor protein [Komagataeibacter sp. FNDCF1]
MTCTAHCDRNGIIGFADGLHFPDGTLPIAYGKPGVIRGVVEVLARHSRKGKRLLVPGIPEATSDHEAFSALMHFTATVLTRNASLRRWPMKSPKGTRS